MRTELEIDEEIAALEANRALLGDERFVQVTAMLRTKLNRVSSSITTAQRRARWRMRASHRGRRPVRLRVRSALLVRGRRAVNSRFRRQ